MVEHFESLSDFLQRVGISDFCSHHNNKIVVSNPIRTVTVVLFDDALDFLFWHIKAKCTHAYPELVVVDGSLAIHIKLVEGGLELQFLIGVQVAPLFIP